MTLLGNYLNKLIPHNIYVRNNIMKLLSYTEKLTKKILFYDSIAKQGLFNMQTNPFFIKKPITIVWVEDEKS